MLEKDDQFNIRLVIGKLEFDGNSVESFILLDYFESVGFGGFDVKIKGFLCERN